MATIKVSYTLQRCACGRELVKVPTGGKEIGSPFVTCPRCGKNYITDLRVEWYAYPIKWLFFSIPFLIALVMLVMGFLMEDAALGVMAAIIGLILGICINLKDLFRIIKSTTRMRSAGYLERLRLAGLISPEDYTRFRNKADKP